MDSLDKVLELIKELIWPFILLVSILIFRKPVSTLLSRVMNFSAEVGKFKLVASMQNHVSENTFQQIRKKPELINTKAEERQITALFAEVRGFTTIYEGMTPNEAVDFIQIFLATMQSLVFKHGGTVDRYNGAAIYAYWGAPIDYPDSAERACKAALDMAEAVRGLSKQFEAKGFPRLNPQYAITTAKVLAGDLGTGTIANYSVFGDYEGILQHLSRLNINYQTNIVLTEYTHDIVGNKFSFKTLSDRIRVKGKDREISIYELIGPKTTVI